MDNYLRSELLGYTQYPNKICEPECTLSQASLGELSEDDNDIIYKDVSDQYELICNLYEIKLSPLNFDLRFGSLHGRVIINDNGKHNKIKQGDVLIQIDGIDIYKYKKDDESELKLKLSELEKKTEIILTFLKRDDDRVRQSLKAKNKSEITKILWSHSNLFESESIMASQKNISPLATLCCERRTLILYDVLHQREGCSLAAHCHQRIANLLKRLGEGEQVIKHLRKSLQMFEKFQPNDLLIHVEVMENLIYALRNMKRFVEAEEICDILLKTWKLPKISGLNIIDHNNNSDNCQFHLLNNNYNDNINKIDEKISKSEMYRRKGMAIHLKATIFRAQGKFAHATNTGLWALHYREKYLGNRHIDVSQSLCFVASTRLEQGETSEREERDFMRSLDIVNECNGAYSANAAAVIRNVAWMLYRRKDYFGAVVQKLKEVALRRALLNHDHNPFKNDPFPAADIQARKLGKGLPMVPPTPEKLDNYLLKIPRNQIKVYDTPILHKADSPPNSPGRFRSNALSDILRGVDEKSFQLPIDSSMINKNYHEFKESYIDSSTSQLSLGGVMQGWDKSFTAGMPDRQARARKKEAQSYREQLATGKSPIAPPQITFESTFNVSTKAIPIDILDSKDDELISQFNSTDILTKEIQNLMEEAYKIEKSRGTDSWNVELKNALIGLAKFLKRFRDTEAKKIKILNSSFASSSKRTTGRPSF